MKNPVRDTAFGRFGLTKPNSSIGGFFIF
jgi:hypothetical protein